MHYNIAYLVDSSESIISSGGYWILAASIILEGLPVLGSLFPGHFIIIFAGFLAKVGILNLWITIGLGIVCVTLADGIGFLLGKKYGLALLSKYGKYIFINEDNLESVKKTMDSHSGKAIFFGKFTPFTRSLAPFLAGASGIKNRTFWIWSILGGISWIVSSVLLGYVFGAGYHLAAGYLGKFIFLAFIATIPIIGAYRFVNARFHVFKKYELIVLGLNLFSLWALGKSIQDSLSLNSFMLNFDIWVNHSMQKFTASAHSLVPIANFVSAVGGISVILTLGIVIGIGFLLKHKWRRGAIMLLSIALTSVSITFMKNLFMRVRPSNAINTLLDPSFPSAHAGLAAAFFVALAYIFVPHIGSWIRREVSIVLCVLAVFLIGLSRLVLNVHWASDVVTGWALGVFIATGSILFIRYLGAFFLRQENK